MRFYLYACKPQRHPELQGSINISLPLSVLFLVVLLCLVFPVGG